MSAGNGSPPWYVWAVVTILVALIGAYPLLKTDPRPTTSDADIVTVFPDFSDRVGTYYGQAYNTMTHSSGNWVFDIKNIDPTSGKVSTHISASNGLSGDGDLFGYINNKGYLDLSGTMTASDSNVEYLYKGEVLGNFITNDSIKGTFRCLPNPGNPFGTQEGTFEVRRAAGLSMT
jgi:hypothetical protein